MAAILPHVKLVVYLNILQVVASSSIWPQAQINFFMKFGM